MKKFLKTIKYGGLVIALVFLFYNAVSAEEREAIPENLKAVAQELGCETKTACAAAFESNFEKGIELAEKYQIYDKTQSEIAKSYKQEVIAKLSDLSGENFEEEIIKIAKEILKKPKVAQTLQVNNDEVKAAETIVTEIKSVGANLDMCAQPANSLSRDQLISCLEASKKLAKQSRVVGRYVPKGVLEQTETAGKMADLDAALARGDYPELGKTADEAGQKCLRSGSESLKSCDEIAEKYFGKEGVDELTRARAQTKAAGDYYLKKYETLELTTPEGKKIIGKDAIRNSCDQAFQNKNIGLAKSCGEFAVKNGFVSKEEMEKSLQMFEKFASKAETVNFEDCRSNPKACEEFIPDEFKEEYNSGAKIYEIMREAFGFEPSICERASFDFELGQKCFEGSQKALPKLKELANNSPEAKRMVSEIEFRIKRGEQMEQRKGEFEKTFINQGGPGGCKNEQECFAYCSDPAHGAECIAFGAKHEVFGQQEAVSRFQQYNRVLQPTSTTTVIYERQDDIRPYPYYQESFRETNQFYQPQQDGYYPPPARGDGYPGGAVGPSPECFAAIEAGDFVKAKEVCRSPSSSQFNQSQYQNYQKPPEPVRRTCPATPEISCQPGYQKIYKTTPDGCGFSECVPPRQQTCPSGQYWRITGENNQGYCAPSDYYSSSSHNSYGEEKEKCYRSGGTWAENYCKYPEYNKSSSGGTSSYGYSSYSNYSSYGGYTGSCPSALANLLGSGCHFMYNDSSGSAIYCNGEMTKSAKSSDTAVTEGCQSGGYYSSGYSSYGNNYSSYSSYSSASSCPTNLLGSGCHEMSSAYFNGAMDQYVNYGGSTVKNCSSEYINGCSSGGSYSSYSYSSYSSYDQSSACAQAGGTWTGSYCQMPQSSSSATYSSPSYDPSAACSQAGGTWNGSACQMPSTSYLDGENNLATTGGIFGKIWNFFSR